MDEDRQLTEYAIERLLAGDIDDLEDEHLLILRAFQSCEENEFAPPSDDDVAKIVAWYDDIIMSQSLIKMVLEGALYIIFDPEEDDICFRLAPKGQNIAREMGFDIPELPSLE